MLRNLGYVMGSIKQPQVFAGIESGRHPLTDYALFLRRNPARAIYYDDVARADARFFEVLKARDLLAWGPPRAVYSLDPPVDAILATGEDVGLPLALEAKARKLRPTIYIITHGFVARDRHLTKSVARLENVRFLCLSERLKQIMIEQFEVPEWRAANTGYGVDVRFFSPVASWRSRPVIVSAGITNRDYHTLLQAVRPFDVDVKIAADSAWYPRSLDMQSASLPPNVEMRSYGDYLNLRRLYGEAAFVVVPLHPASFACGYAVIVEAMAMGKAVIATKTASHGDFIVDGETGYYVRPGDVEQMREKIAHLLADPAQAREMGRRARQQIEREFSQERYCERLEHAIAAMA